MANGRVVRLSRILGAHLVCVLLTAAPVYASEARSALVHVLEDGAADASTTRRAIRAVGEQQEVEAIPALLKLLFLPRNGQTFEIEARFALFQIGRPSSDAVLRVLKREDGELSRWAEKNHIPESWLLAEASTLAGDFVDVRARSPLLRLLRYENSDKQLELAVRGRAAAALGRLRTNAAVVPITALVATTNLQARHEFVHALVSIGSREALPALARAAAEGDWDVRKVAMDGFTLLASEREAAAYDKLLDREAALITSDCSAHPNYRGCGDQDALLARMLGSIRSFAKRLSAAGRCKQSAECWTESLKDQDSVVRQRAVLELGRQGANKAVEALAPAALGEDAAVRLEALQSLEWLLAKDTKARALQAKRLSEFEVSLAHGKETVAGARFDAPLRRLIHRIRGH